MKLTLKTDDTENFGIDLSGVFKNSLSPFIDICF